MTESLIEVGKVVGSLVAMAGLIVLLGKAIRAMFRTVRKLGRLADEVLGEGEHPGWGKRLTAIEQDVGTLKTKLGTVLAEVKPNGGSSMRDAVDRIEQATGATIDEQHP